MSDAGPRPDQPSRRLSHYEILEELGAGGMGVLYRARDTRLERTVAVKLLRPQTPSDADSRWRFAQEARAASALNHPNIVTIYEIDREPGPDGADFIVMEYIDGQSLSRVVSGRPLGIDEALGYAIPIASALGAAHAAGIVHRDVKPANVMVSASGQVKVLDFGLAKLAAPLAATPDGATASGTVTTGPRTTDGTILGTPAYMSPEQAEGKPVDARSDVFSLGAVLYEMLAGRRPFQADTAVGLLSAILRDTPPSLRSLRADLPRELERVVGRCLEKDRTARYPDAGAVARDLDAIRAQRAAPPGAAALLRRRTVAVPLALMTAAALAAGAWAWQKVRRERWARQTAMPELASLAVDLDSTAAGFRLARHIQPILGDDPAFRDLLRQVSVTADVGSDPPGAEVEFRGYHEPDAPWEVVGRTPLTQVVLPGGYLRWRISKPGYEPLELASMSLRLGRVTLTPVGQAAAGMVRVPAGRYGWRALPPIDIPAFWLDRYEVTNAEYKRFVDQGGYRRPELWKHPFVVDGRGLSVEEGMARFQDPTGRPGPATWELGAYPEGKGDLPVGGVSWYEAAAYAEFAGKTLPSVYHWTYAAGFDIFSDILGFSNFSGQGPHAVGRGKGMSPFGSYDMAGNLREWCFNASGGRRFLLGGAWSDPTYMFTGAEALSPFDRTPTNGIRLARYDAPPAGEALAAVTPTYRDVSKEKPVPDSVFEVYRGLFAYDPLDLAARAEAAPETGEHWRKEKVTIAAAYDGERLPLYLFLPRSGRPPYQVVLYFPPGSANLIRSSAQIGAREFGFIVRSGRAVVLPVYMGTYERRLQGGAPGPSVYRDMVIRRVKDARRAIDYVASRPDLDATRVGYYGISLGATMGTLIPALEPRVRAVVLTSGGFAGAAQMPEVEGVNYAPRVTVPTLMINGRQDFVFPVEQAQLPLFRLLGAPSKDKRHYVFEGGHVPPREQDVMRETLGWLDRYLGPVALP